MTSPFGQEIVKVPGIGEELQNAIAPFVHAMQFQRQLQNQKAEEDQRIAAQLFVHGLQTVEGFENTPAAQELSNRLGTPGLATSIAGARTAEAKKKVADINTFVEGFSGVSDKAKSALRATLIAGNIHHATSETQNNIFSMMATGEDAGILERARLENLQANTQHLLAETERMKREPKPQDQQRAAQILGIDPNGPQYAGDNFPYVNVLEDFLKQKPKSPADAVRVFATSLMVNMKDMLGRPSQTPAETMDIALQQVKFLYPKTASELKLTPEMEQNLAATRAATLMWQGLLMDERTLKDATGRVLRKFKTNKEIRDYIGEEMKHVFPLVDQPSLNLLMDIIQRRVTESF